MALLLFYLQQSGIAATQLELTLKGACKVVYEIVSDNNDHLGDVISIGKGIQGVL